MAKIITRSQSSALKINHGSVFDAQTPIDKFSGKLIKDTESVVLGQGITLEDGKLESGSHKSSLSAKVEGDIASITLDGGKTFRGKRSHALQSLTAQGASNRVEGVFAFRQDLVLQDHLTSLTVALTEKMPQNIQMNGGHLSLAYDLVFVDGFCLKGAGSIAFNNRRLVLGSQDLLFEDKIFFENAQEIALNANIYIQDDWLFSGKATINGNGNTIFLEGNGRIVVEPRSSLLLKNVSVQNVADHNICCMDNYATISLHDSSWYHSNDFTFTVGKLAIIDRFALRGARRFIYRSGAHSCIYNHGTMLFDKGMTFSYDPLVIASPSLCMLEGSLAELCLHNASLHATTTGLHLTKGKVSFSGECGLSSQVIIDEQIDEVRLDNGITFGNDTLEDDCTIHLADGALVKLRQGSVKYRNLNVLSWQQNPRATLAIGSDCTLKLYQSLDTHGGRIVFDNFSSLARYEDTQLIGNVDVNGIVGYDAL